MQVNPEDGPPEIYVTWSDPRMTDFENGAKYGLFLALSYLSITLWCHADFNNWDKKTESQVARPDRRTDNSWGLQKFKRARSLWLALPIEDRERNLTKSILARVCTLKLCGYSTLLRRVQWKVHKNTLLKQDIFLLWGGTNLHECLEWTEICP